MVVVVFGNRIIGLALIVKRKNHCHLHHHHHGIIFINDDPMMIMMMTINIKCIYISPIITRKKKFISILLLFFPIYFFFFQVFTCNAKMWRFLSFFYVLFYQFHFKQTLLLMMMMIFKYILFTWYTWIITEHNKSLER